MTDEQLAQRVQQGDSEALSALVERHYDGLLGYLYRMLGGQRSLAEDLVQETFLRTMRGISGYTHPRPFKPWLYAIATNLGRNYYNRAETRLTTADDDLLATIENDEPGIEDALTHQRDVEQVIILLGKLPDHQREVVILRYYQEWSLADIADTLNIPIGTVKSRISLGLTRLRQMMLEGMHEQESH